MTAASNKRFYISNLHFLAQFLQDVTTLHENQADVLATLRENTVLKKIAAAASLLSLLTSANSMVLEGSLGNKGFALLNLQVTSAGFLDFTDNSGKDSFLSVFDASGNHIITADDSELDSSFILRRHFDVGNYSLMVGACCTYQDAVYTAANVALILSDGFNVGIFYSGGDVTLNDTVTAMNSNNYVPPESYSFSVNGTNISINTVPEPGSLALAGLALAGMATVSRRRKP